MNEQSPNINPLPPTNEAQTIIQQSKDKLPKLKLGEDERLYISIEQLSKINGIFYDFLSDMKQGAAHAPAELHSYMNSVAYHAYVEEIAKLRRDNQLECDVEWERVDTLTALLTPRTRRGWFFRKKRNQAQVLLDELIGRQSWNYLKRKQDELPEYGEEQEAPVTPYMLQIEELKALLPRKMRKKKRAVWETLIEGLAVSYDNKVSEQKRTAEELEEVREQFRQAQERISELEELTAQLIEES